MVIGISLVERAVMVDRFKIRYCDLYMLRTYCKTGAHLPPAQVSVEHLLFLRSAKSDNEQFTKRGVMNFSVFGGVVGTERDKRLLQVV